MDIVQGVGASGREAIYGVPDDQMAVGSTLGGPKAMVMIKATGAIAKVYGSDTGETLFGTVALRHYDQHTGMHLAQRGTGTFTLHPEHQEHDYTLVNGMAVHENIFVLSGPLGDGGTVDPPAVYYTVRLRNGTKEEHRVATYAFCELRGETAHDVMASYDKRHHALVAWNKSNPQAARVFGCSAKPTSFETTLDYAKAVTANAPGELSCAVAKRAGEPLGILHLTHTLAPGTSACFSFLLSFAQTGERDALKTYAACPPAEEALARTMQHYHDVLSRAVLLTPNPQVNRGVLWAKANMLRVQCKAPTGWSFTNDPMRSNNSVGRDTAWFAFGADYVTPEFVRESLLTYVRMASHEVCKSATGSRGGTTKLHTNGDVIYVRLQEKSGKVIEYYDIRTGKTADYGLNINDNTPLLILALWHHYNATGDEGFLSEIYPAAARAARYILSQRNEQGLVWCAASGTSDWGIVGWRNVIPNYRLSGATTEVNAECYAALHTVSQMARVLGRHEESAVFADEAAALKGVINTNLRNPDNGLYHLNIDLQGQPRSDVTSDLVFPVIFGVAPEPAAAHIVGRLSSHDFWTAAGIRTAPRDAPTYTPDGGSGLLGGVWVGVSFWYAFAAAHYNPAFMDHALATSFANYSRNPRQNNTVPGQFSEWLHGETLVNQGMMLSPWFPPRYLWAAIEGAAGVEPLSDGLRLHPRLAPAWKWLAVQSLPYRGRRLTWFVARTPDVTLYASFHPQESPPYHAYDEDITAAVKTIGDGICGVGLRKGADAVVLVGNTEEQSVTTAVAVTEGLSGSYRVRVFDSLLVQWADHGLVPAAKLATGITLQIERKGFWVLDLHQEA